MISIVWENFFLFLIFRSSLLYFFTFYIPVNAWFIFAFISVAFACFFFSFIYFILAFLFIFINFFLEFLACMWVRIIFMNPYPCPGFSSTLSAQFFFKKFFISPIFFIFLIFNLSPLTWNKNLRMSLFFFKIKNFWAKTKIVGHNSQSYLNGQEDWGLPVDDLEVCFPFDDCSYSSMIKKFGKAKRLV